MSTPPHIDAVTAGDIARALGVPIKRVNYVLESRVHIQPIGRVGIVRLFGPDVVEMVRAELNAITARRLPVTAG